MDTNLVADGIVSALAFLAEGKMQTSQVERLMDVAAGRVPADLAVRGGRVLSVFSGQVIPSDLLISSGRIAAVVPPGSGDASEMLDATDAVICPGLIDAHFHIGGSHMDVSHLAAALLARGTTGVATDFYEIYVASGPPGVRAALDQAAAAKLQVLFVPPAHLIGLEDTGTFAWDVSLDDLRDMVRWPEAVGINEPPASAVLARLPGLVELLTETMDLNKLVVGHAPNETGLGLQAYVAAGASSDHESRDVAEALAKLQVGMRPMMRHGSASPDLPRLIQLVLDYPDSARFMMFCSDEMDPHDLATEGHMDAKVRLAIEAGVDPVTAIRMGTINVAEYYGAAARVGSVAPGRSADLVLVPDLGDFRPEVVMSGGRLVARSGVAEPISPSPLPERTVSRVQSSLLKADDFEIQAPGGGDEVWVRVIGVTDGTLVSDERRHRLPVRAGAVAPSLKEDVLPIAVVERHRGTGRIGKAFVQGFGLQNGAVATTYCHVYHNMLVVGSDYELMATAAEEVRRLGGGIAVVQDGGVIASWRLPLVGVLDERPLAAVHASFAEIGSAIARIGCTLKSPILSLSFVALPTIPAYGLTDKGLYHVPSQEFVSLFPDGPT